MSIVPFISPFISICLLLHCEELRPNKLLEFCNLHSCSAYPRNVKRSRFIVIVCEAMWRVVLTALEAYVFSILVHLLKEEEQFGVVSVLRCLN